MRRLTSLIGLALAFAVAGTARAQTSDIVGKVLDLEGKPIAGAEVSAWNVAVPDRVSKETSDKKGNFRVSGLLFAAQATQWTVSIKAERWVPVSVKIVARDAQRTMYFSDDVKLSAAKPSADVRMRAFAEIRMDYTMRPGDAAAEAAPALVPEGAVPGAAAEPDSYALAIEKVRAGDPEGSIDLFKKAI